MESLVLHILTEYHNAVITLVVLPLGFLFDLFVDFHKKVTRFLTPHDTHESRAQQVVQAVKAWNDVPESQRKPMCTDRASWLNLSTRFVNKSVLKPIRLSHLYNILKLDKEKMTVRVEPLVTVGEATAFLTKQGYTLACTLEIMDATLGGLAIAVGMTTHSHRVGLLQETVVAWDIVTGSGDLLHVTEKEHPDLFRCIPWSHGTLGFVVALELKVVPVKPYVHLSYLPFHKREDYCRVMRQLSTTEENPPDYLEGTIFSKEEGVITVGYYADVTTADQKSRINQLGLWFKPWWFKHVETFLKRGRGDEYIPLKDYLLRHNRSIFWVVADMIAFGNNPLFRLLFGWLLPPKPAFLKFTTTPGVRKMTFTHQVFQDITLPMTALEESIDVSEKLFDIYPVLIYPCRIYNHGIGEHQGQIRPPRESDMVPGTNYAMFYDLGVYGVPGFIKNKLPYNPTTAYRAMEEFIRRVGGYSFLYADTFLTEDEFEEMFDLTLYNAVRKQYGAEKAFPTLFKKITPEIDVVAAGNAAAIQFSHIAAANAPKSSKAKKHD